MSAIDDELKKMLAEQQSADTALKTAAAALAKSQEELNAAKSKEAAAAQRVAPLQQLARELESSTAAATQQRQATAREIDEAWKLYVNVFPAISEEINPVARKALEDADAACVKAGEDLEVLRLEIDKASAAQAAAQATAEAAQARVRALKAELGSLSDRIESARQRLTVRLTAVRDSIAANKIGTTFVTLRELEMERTATAALVDESVGEDLLKKIDAAHTEAAAATEEAARQLPILDALQQERSAAVKDLESKRQAARDAQAAVKASQAT